MVCMFFPESPQASLFCNIFHVSVDGVYTYWLFAVPHILAEEAVSGKVGLYFVNSSDLFAIIASMIPTGQREPPVANILCLRTRSAFCNPPFQVFVMFYSFDQCRWCCLCQGLWPTWGPLSWSGGAPGVPWYWIVGLQYSIWCSWGSLVCGIQTLFPIAAPPPALLGCVLVMAFCLCQARVAR